MNTIIKKGMILTLTTGCYSNYKDHGPFVALIDFDKRDVTDAFLTTWEKTPHEYLDMPSGWLHATGRYDLEVGNDFIEGYGPRKDMGISASVISTETEVSNV